MPTEVPRLAFTFSVSLKLLVPSNEAHQFNSNWVQTVSAKQYLSAESKALDSPSISPRSPRQKNGDMNTKSSPRAHARKSTISQLILFTVDWVKPFLGPFSLIC